VLKLNEDISTYLEKLFGKDSPQKYFDYINLKPSQYIRVNTLRISPEELSGLLLKNYGIQTQKIENIPFALKVIEKSELTGKTIEHITGLYYIESLASMMPPLVLNPLEDDAVLDLCAAPGSKTTQLAQMMKNHGTLIANEVQIARVKSLVFNIDRMAITNCGVIHSKGEILSKIFHEYFDKILVDAPCSGLGIIQKKEEVNDWWNEKRINVLCELQLRLLIAAVKMLKVGGEVVYSTCTLTLEENEQIINKVLNKYPVEVEEIALPLTSREGFTSIEGNEFNGEITKAKRIVPWESNTEGFFIVKLKKTGETESPLQNTGLKKSVKFFSYKNKEINNYLKAIENDFAINDNILQNYKYLIKKNNIFFINREWDDSLPDTFNRVGIKLGNIDKRGGITLHTNAAEILGGSITKNIYEINEMEELIIYLEGGIIKDTSLETGQYVIKYNNFILGTAVVTSGGLKSRFPRAKRTQEIYFNF